MGKNYSTILWVSLLLLGGHTSFSADNGDASYNAESLATMTARAALRLQPGGYENDTFDFEIEVTPDVEKSGISISTSFDRTLQYTLSSVEGRILGKGRLVKEGWMNVSRLQEGSYVMYFFRGHRVVKAVLIDRI